MQKVTIIADIIPRQCSKVIEIVFVKDTFKSEKAFLKIDLIIGVSSCAFFITRSIKNEIYIYTY